MKQHVLDERYRIIEIAGRGGMACVYRAEDFITGDTVAIKVLPPQMASRQFHSARISPTNLELVFDCPNGQSLCLRITINGKTETNSVQS